MTAPDRPGWVPTRLYPFGDRYAEIDGSAIHYVDEGAGPDHAKVPVEVFDLRLPGHRRRSAEAIQHVQSPFRPLGPYLRCSDART